MPRAVAEVTYTLEQLGGKGTSCLAERLTDPGFKANLVASGNPHFDEETLAILRRLVLGGDEAMSWAPRAVYGAALGCEMVAAHQVAALARR